MCIGRTPRINRDSRGKITNCVDFDDSHACVISNILYDDHSGDVVIPATLWLVDLLADPSYDLDNNISDSKTKQYEA